MNSTPRYLAGLYISIILFACRIFSPTSQPTISPTPISTNLNTPPPVTSIPSFPPLPSISPTTIPPSLTPTGVATPSPTSTAIPTHTQLRIFQNLWNVVNDTYVYPDFNGLDWNAMHLEYQQIISTGLTNSDFYSAMEELITRLGDDHSFFLDPQQVAEQNAEYEGKHDYVGIGILVSAVPQREHAVILSVFPGSPAETAGLQPRDSLISVDGNSILDELGYLRDIVRGPEGTSIKILVQSPGMKSRELSITRQRITGDYPVSNQVITTPEGKRIGYILLVTFMDATVDEQVAQALEDMTANAPLDGLILDNRMNSGGSSTVFEPLLGNFIGGRLGYFVQRSKQFPLQIKINDITGSSQIPLVVLVGPDTMSFGEIFAGILQDTRRAYIIGTTTDGNVEILWGYDFEDGSQLWLANETFLPLNNPEEDWEKSGIIPDLIVPGDFDQFSLNTDPCIIAAIHYFSDQ